MDTWLETILAFGFPPCVVSLMTIECSHLIESATLVSLKEELKQLVGGSAVAICVVLQSIQPILGGKHKKNKEKFE